MQVQTTTFTVMSRNCFMFWIYIWGNGYFTVFPDLSLSLSIILSWTTPHYSLLFLLNSFYTSFWRNVIFCNALVLKWIFLSKFSDNTPRPSPSTPTPITPHHYHPPYFILDSHGHEAREHAEGEVRGHPAIDSYIVVAAIFGGVLFFCCHLGNGVVIFKWSPAKNWSAGKASSVCSV